MRKQNLFQLKQKGKHSIKVSTAIFISAFLWLNPAFSQTAEEQQWWFDVELIAFKRSLLPTNNEDFSKANFVSTQAIPIDLFSLTLLRQQAPLQFYIELLEACKPINASGTTMEETLAQNSSQAKPDTESNSFEVTSSEVTSPEVTSSKVNSSGVNSPEVNNKPDEVHNQKPIAGALPAPFRFERETPTQGTLLCLQAMQNDEQLGLNAQWMPDDISALQAISEIPARIFLDNAPFYDEHSLLSQADIKLEDYTQKVLRQRDIKPLLYTAWRQEVIFGEQNAEYYQIKAGKKLEVKETFDYEQALARYNSANIQDTEGTEEQSNKAFFEALGKALEEKEGVDWLAQQPVPDTDIFQQDTQSAQWELDGLFKVYLDYVNQVPYLHVDTEFKHYKIKIDENGQGKIDTYPLKQRRRIVSKQIHYFDHPGFGIIIRLERFTPPAPEVLEQID